MLREKETVTARQRSQFNVSCEGLTQNAAAANQMRPCICGWKESDGEGSISSGGRSGGLSPPPRRRPDGGIIYDPRYPPLMPAFGRCFKAIFTIQSETVTHCQVWVSLLDLRSHKTPRRPCEILRCCFDQLLKPSEIQRTSRCSALFSSH